MLGKMEGRRRKGTREDERVGYHHQLNGHEFELTPQDSGGQRRLLGCSPLVAESDMTEGLTLSL